MPNPASPFTGVVLTGGRSTRMGRDKTLITLPNGRTLLGHAVQTLRAAGAADVIVSVRPGQTHCQPGTREVPDDIENCGPLAGLAAALAAANTERVVVLAVDLPAMNADYLRSLLRHCTSTVGAVPKHGEFFEPLAAVFPKSAANSARDALIAGRLSLQVWVNELAGAGLVHEIAIEPNETGYFANWNSPADLPSA